MSGRGRGRRRGAGAGPTTRRPTRAAARAAAAPISPARGRGRARRRARGHAAPSSPPPQREASTPQDSLTDLLALVRSEVQQMLHQSSTNTTADDNSVDPAQQSGNQATTPVVRLSLPTPSSGGTSSGQGN